jgi:hypothetical protein
MEKKEWAETKPNHRFKGFFFLLNMIKTNFKLKMRRERHRWIVCLGRRKPLLEQQCIFCVSLSKVAQGSLFIV